MDWLPRRTATPTSRLMWRVVSRGGSRVNSRVGCSPRITKSRSDSTDVQRPHESTVELFRLSGPCHKVRATAPPGQTHQSHPRLTRFTSNIACHSFFGRNIRIPCQHMVRDLINSNTWSPALYEELCSNGGTRTQRRVQGGRARDHREEEVLR